MPALTNLSDQPVRIGDKLLVRIDRPLTTDAEVHQVEVTKIRRQLQNLIDAGKIGVVADVDESTLSPYQRKKRKLTITGA